VAFFVKPTAAVPVLAPGYQQRQGNVSGGNRGDSLHPPPRHKKRPVSRRGRAFC
jgi:hypothetical protein